MYVTQEQSILIIDWIYLLTYLKDLENEGNLIHQNLNRIAISRIVSRGLIVNGFRWITFLMFHTTNVLFVSVYLKVCRILKDSYGFTHTLLRYDRIYYYKWRPFLMHIKYATKSLGFRHLKAIKDFSAQLSRGKGISSERYAIP